MLVSACFVQNHTHFEVLIGKQGFPAPFIFTFQKQLRRGLHGSLGAGGTGQVIPFSLEDAILKGLLRGLRRLVDCCLDMLDRDEVEMHPIQGMDKAMAGAESPVQDLACFCPETVACVQRRREKVVLVPNGSWQKRRESCVYL